MNESASATSSTLAIAEKRPRRTGGCVGIFFQLFDWNRRLAKKKLFSKRLLPPDRAKEASKKFGGDEKLSKLRLIADENSGGFPCMKKRSSVPGSVKKNGVQTPSLVARLMGLESMPSVHRDKPHKDSSGEFRVMRREKVVGDSDEFVKETIRQEFRPQKLQKTGMVERKTVTRFGAEALQLKNVLSRSRKHHHPKLASPVKNTSHHARRNTSRLIDAATRILEPGLQARNKTKYAITYPHSERRSRGNEVRSDSINGKNLNPSESSNRQASCKNCGNLLDIQESTSKRDVHDRTSLFDSVYSSQEQVFSVNKVPLDQGCQVLWHSTNQQSHPQNCAPQVHIKDNTRRQVDVSLYGDGVSSHSKLICLPFNKVQSATDAVSDTKDFVALNRSLSGQTRSRISAKVEDTKRSKFDLPSGHKRQSTHIRKQGETSGIVGSSINRRRMVKPDACSLDRVCIGGSGNKNSDGMPFRFSSPMKNRCEVPMKVDRRRNQNVSPCKTTSRKKFTSNQTNEKICLQKPSLLTCDFLEEKLIESGINGTPPNRARSSTFEERIRALNMERQRPQNDIESSPQKNHLSSYGNRWYDHNASFCLQTKPEIFGAFVGHKNNDHLSPGSVLEASFSNDSSSFEDSSGWTHHADSMSYSYDESLFLDSETDPFYSDVSLRKINTRNVFVPGILTYISEVLCSIDVFNARIKGNKRTYVKEVVFNSELVLQNPNDIDSFLLCHFLLELDTLAEVMWTEFGNFVGPMNSNTGYQLKLFVFDCLIEYLDSKYGKYSKCGIRAWMKISRFMDFEILIGEVVEDVRRWASFVGVTLDELVESDMSHGLGKWADFEIQACEIGAKIEGDIVHVLVDEIVVDIITGVRIRY